MVEGDVGGVGVATAVAGPFVEQGGAAGEFFEAGGEVSEAVAGAAVGDGGSEGFGEALRREG